MPPSSSGFLLGAKACRQRALEQQKLEKQKEEAQEEEEQEPQEEKRHEKEHKEDYAFTEVLHQITAVAACFGATTPKHEASQEV